VQIDFSRLGRPQGPSAPGSLIELFEQLDRKASHNSLRPVQIEALVALDKSIRERDIVVKLSTGSGKTVVGLVYAEFMRRKYPAEPSIYLCPTKQLVDQVLESAQCIGVAAETFSPEGHAWNGLQGRAILVCTYDRLFNARNTFASRQVIPASIVLDDVHAGLEKVRQKFTVRVPDSLFDQLKSIFRPVCEPTDPAIWRGIMNSEAQARYEVPYWLWIPQYQTIAALLDAFKDKQELMFEWSNLSRYIEYARCCISGAGAELSLPVAAVEENAPYTAAKHRVFMSASIKDGSPLLRDMDLDEGSLERIVQPESDRGAGERMILPIALIEPSLNKTSVGRICADVSKSANVVVLTSSAKQALGWTSAGAAYVQGAAVDEEIQRLNASKRGRFVVFAQRFDGVDLPDDACRVLVLDGIPTGERLSDQIDASRQRNSPGYNARTVNRFEQALGRAVRSSADYAAILLVGTDLAAFVGRKEVRDALESHTREQIELGQDVADQLKASGNDSVTAIRSAIGALIDRDSSWKEAHRQRMAAVAKRDRTDKDLNPAERASVAERTAWISAKARNHQNAFSVIQNALDSLSLHPLQRAELMFRAAAYLHRVDPARATQLYQSAFQLNSALPRPAEALDKRYSRIKQQSVNVRDALQSFTGHNAALARLEEIRAMLAFSGDAEIVEEGLKALGEIVGAQSSRPERETGRGPDVLWLFDSIGLCIEAKNEKKRPIFKSDAEQLLMSQEWCRKNTDLQSEQIVPVFATDVVATDRLEDVSFGPLFLTEAIAFEIVDRFRSVLTSVSFNGPLFMDIRDIDRRIKDSKLTGEQLSLMLAKLKDRPGK